MSFLNRLVAFLRLWRSQPPPVCSVVIAEDTTTNSTIAVETRVLVEKPVSAEEISERIKRRTQRLARQKIADTASDALDRFKRLNQKNLESGCHSLDAQQSLEWRAMRKHNRVKARLKSAK